MQDCLNFKDLGQVLRKDLDREDWIQHKNPDGTVGGWKQKSAKVSSSVHVGSQAVVYDFATVVGEAKIYNDARVYGNAIVCGKARVSDNSEVFGNAIISGSSMIYGNAVIYGNAKVFDSGSVKNAIVAGNTNVFGNALLRSLNTTASAVLEDDYYSDEEIDIEDLVSSQRETKPKHGEAFQVVIHWGDKQTRIEENSKKTSHYFSTRMEMDAYLQGVMEAKGWIDCEIVKETRI